MLILKKRLFSVVYLKKTFYEFIKFGFLIFAVIFVISSQTNLLTDKGSITNTYKITCGQNRCVIYNPKNGAYKPVIWDYMNAVKWSHQIGDKASF